MGAWNWHSGTSREWRLGQDHAAPEVCHDDVGHLQAGVSQQGLTRQTTMLGYMTEDLYIEHTTKVREYLNWQLTVRQLQCTPLATKCSKAQCQSLWEQVVGSARQQRPSSIDPES